MIASSGVLLADEAHAQWQAEREGGPISDAVLENGNAQWREDVLGHGFDATELTLLPGAIGEAGEAAGVGRDRELASSSHMSGSGDGGRD